MSRNKKEERKNSNEWIKVESKAPDGGYGWIVLACQFVSDAYIHDLKMDPDLNLLMQMFTSY